jgi:cobalamin transport system ATP-binding protein
MNRDNIFQSNDKSVLTVSDLSTGYNASGAEKRILHKQLNCEVGSGEFIAILGPNGAGKSTLLKTLSGILPAVDGKVFFSGKNLREMSNREIARSVALVLTDKINDKYLKSIDIVGTGRYPYGSFMGRLTKKDVEIIQYALEVVGVSDLAQRYFYSLSDGEKQKVLLARAIAQDTPVIFLDEPAAFIDSPGKVIIMSLLSQFVNEFNKSILLTSHDTELALSYARNVWLLGKDNQFYQGKPDELVNNGLINKLFDSHEVKFNKNTRKFEHANKKN